MTKAWDDREAVPLAKAPTHGIASALVAYALAHLPHDPHEAARALRVLDHYLSTPD